MFNSLRSRLWLTYALLIGLVLFVVGTAIVLVVYRGNIPLQQAAINLQALRVNALPRLQSVGDLDADILQTLLVNNTNQIRGRIVVLTNDGRVVADSLNVEGANLPEFGDTPILTEIGTLPNFYRDSAKQNWYYIIERINQDRLAFFAVSRPRFQIVTIFRDQYLAPLAQAGLLALLVAFILSLLMSRWITAPLRRISREARQVADGRAHPIPLEGPEEVRQLAASFNTMTHQVQESQQSQKDFIANVSHELKTPLTSIQGFARAIQDGTAHSPEELAQAADVIGMETARMHRLVQDLLTLTKLEAGSIAFSFETLDINPLLDAAQHKFTPRTEAAGIQFDMRKSETPAFVYGDPDRLMQLLDNLLDNALKFTPAGGRITLRCELNGETVWIHVIDSGKGIPKDEQNRIFERFYQVDKARTGGEVRGYGLGLAICQQIVQAHDGELSVTSQPGEGSHFVVKIPLQQ
ncbi:HAMP domain-containing histidine kinase [Chloroflexota bacterium]|nr:HAMP domain-containing histidine kinase [Chloroflexota bacterium]